MSSRIDSTPASQHHEELEHRARLEVARAHAREGERVKASLLALQDNPPEGSHRFWTRHLSRP